jgi:Ca2+:H+ antiporter
VLRCSCCLVRALTVLRVWSADRRAVYLCYCIFQLVTHKDLFADKAAPSVRYGERRTSTATDTLELLPALPRAPTADGAPEEPTLHPAVLGALLLADVVLVWYSSDVLVRSIGGLTARYPALSREFVGLVLLPIVGNAAEHWTAVASASRNRLSLSLSVAIGSSLQIALFGKCITMEWGRGR